MELCCYYMKIRYLSTLYKDYAIKNILNVETNI